MPATQDYEMIAETVRAIADPDVREGRAYVHATRFEQSNARFDRLRFLGACGLAWDCGLYREGRGDVREIPREYIISVRGD